MTMMTCDCALLDIPTTAATNVEAITIVTTVLLMATLLLQVPTRVGMLIQNHGCMKQ
jgi:hypothetical protein